MRILILGGTTEASALAQLLAGDPRFEATLSLAGRTSTPRPQPLPARSGGFGGVDGLVRYLENSRTETVVDATHPYADQMSAHAVEACRQTGVPLVSLVRPPWMPQQGDDWRNVATTEAAALALGATPRRVFLAIGRQELPVFAKAPQHHYLARVIEVPHEILPPDLVLIEARGPFDLAAETTLLRDEKIEVVVSKNAGSTATYAKIEAARALGLPVIMIARPEKPAGQVVTCAEEAVAWLAHARPPRSLRGV
jgi:precorrin-6A/cobalt-precorrin-6A reductase